jgi:hypothetical protein
MCDECTDAMAMDDEEFIATVAAGADGELALPPISADQEFDEHGRGYWNCPGMDAQVPSGSESADLHVHEVRFPALKTDANLVSSLSKDGKHRPVLDFDFPVRYVASTTPGHGHLYIDKPMRWGTYKKLIEALMQAGLLEKGYANAALKRKATFVRPPWVKKPPAEQQ